MKSTKVKFSEQHPIVGLILLTYGSFLMAQFVIGTAVGYLLGILTGLDYLTTIAMAAVVGSLIVLAFWYKKNSPEYRFIPKKEEFLGSLKLLSPIILYSLILLGLYSMIAGRISFAPIAFSSLVTCLMAGFSEEIIFREIAISYMTKRWKTEKMIPVIAGISGLMFGLTHITNAVGGGKITDFIYQAVLSVFFGYFFSAVYLRKGNVWALILAHSVYDILALSYVQGLYNVGIKKLPDQVAVVIFAVELMLGAYGYFLIRRSKRKEILEFWKSKWGNENLEEIEATDQLAKH